MAKSKKKTYICKQGDRVVTPNGKWGTVSRIRGGGTFPYEITWDSNSKTEHYKEKNFSDWGWTIHPAKEHISCLDNSIYAVGSASDSPLLDFNLEDSNSLDSVSKTITAEISLTSDIQTPKSTQILGRSQLWKESTVSQPPLLALLSQSKEKGSEQTTQEIVSPQSLERSQASSPDSLQSKTFTDSLVAPTNPDTQSDISVGSQRSYPCAGLMLNGSVSRVDTLVAPLLDDGCSWLESPGALSSTGNGRPPGQSKLEAQLRNLGAIALQEVVNPTFLEDAFQIPLGWCDPSEHRAATALLDDKEKRSETASILAWQRWRWLVFCTLIAFWKNEISLVCKSLECNQNGLQDRAENNLGVCRVTPSQESSTSTTSLSDSGLVISFGKTYPQLLSGKSVTRRLWKLKHAIKFAKAYQKGLRVKAFDKDQRYGGKQIGWLTLLEKPYQQILSDMPESDLAAEGFPELSLREFCDRFFEGNLCQYLWVVRFSFEPLESERALEPDIADSLEKSQTHTSTQSGSLYWYTKNVENKEGLIITYPKWENIGERPKPEQYVKNVEHDKLWYWGISYETGTFARRESKSKPISQSMLNIARELIGAKCPVEVTIALCQLKPIWMERKGNNDNWLIGETKPSKCPRLFVFSFVERELFVTDPGWGESTAVYRQRKREKLSQAIADDKPFAYIKEILK